MRKKTILLLSVSAILILLASLAFFYRPENSSIPQKEAESQKNQASQKSPLPPLAIEALRNRNYEGGEFEIDRPLANGTNYRQFIASYISDGLKVYGLLTVPTQQKPEKGYPGILFVHGYIPPEQYSTTGNYSAYQAILARNGFVTFKPDLRGHGRSEGDATSAHFSEDYVVDALNAIEYLKDYSEVDPQRIGYWGHSNGGEIGLRVATISEDVKAAVFWAGVVGSHQDLFETYKEKIPFLRNRGNPLVDEHGLPSSNPEFWTKIDPYYYLSDINSPIQLHHGTGDASVPVELSRHLKEEIEKQNKNVEYYEYRGDDHNLRANLALAWQRTVEFYKNNL